MCTYKSRTAEICGLDVGLDLTLRLRALVPFRQCDSRPVTTSVRSLMYRCLPFLPFSCGAREVQALKKIQINLALEYRMKQGKV